MVELSSGVIAILIVAILFSMVCAIEYGYRVGWKIKQKEIIKRQEAVAARKRLRAVPLNRGHHETGTD